MGRGLRELVQGAHSPDLEMDRLIPEAAVVTAQGRSGQKMRRCPQGQVRGPSRGVGMLHKLGRALLLSESRDGGCLSAGLCRAVLLLAARVTRILPALSIPSAVPAAQRPRLLHRLGCSLVLHCLRGPV